MVSLIKCKMNPKWILRNFYFYAFGNYVPIWTNQALTEKLSKVFTQILRFPWLIIFVGLWPFGGWVLSQFTAAFIIHV